MKYYVAFLTEGMVPVVSPFPPFSRRAAGIIVFDSYKAPA
jgi:hypothetical protein